MDMNGFMAQRKRIGNLLHAFAFHQQLKHFALARSERLKRFWHRLAAAQRFYRIGAEVMPAHADGAHGLHQLLRAAALGQVAACTRVEGTLHKGRCVVDAQDDGAKRRPLLAQALEQAKAVFVRHCDVHHRHVDIVARQGGPRLRRAAKLALNDHILFQI